MKGLILLAFGLDNYQLPYTAGVRDVYSGRQLANQPAVRIEITATSTLSGWEEIKETYSLKGDYNMGPIPSRDM